MQDVEEPEGSRKPWGQLSDEKKDQLIQRQAKEIDELKAKLKQINTKVLDRADFLFRELNKMMEPFSDLRNTTALVEMTQHQINEQAQIKAELREVKRMVGIARHEQNESETLEQQIESLLRSGMSELEVAELLKARNGG